MFFVRKKDKKKRIVQDFNEQTVKDKYSLSLRILELKKNKFVTQQLKEEKIYTPKDKKLRVEII